MTFRGKDVAITISGLRARYGINVIALKNSTALAPPPGCSIL